MAIVTIESIFFGWTKAELEEALRQLKIQIAEHGMDYLTSVSINGKSAGKSQRLSIRRFVSELRAALQSLDPDTYGTTKGTTVSSFYNS